MPDTQAACKPCEHSVPMPMHHATAQRAHLSLSSREVLALCHPSQPAHTTHTNPPPLLLLTWLDGKAELEVLPRHKLLQVRVLQRLPYLPVFVLPKRVEVLAERPCPRVCSHHQHHQTKKPNATCEEDWVLRDDAQPRPQVVEPDGGDVDTIHPDGPRGWLDKPEQRQGQAALASARAPNNPKLLASLDREGDVLRSVAASSVAVSRGLGGHSAEPLTRSTRSVSGR